MPHTYSIICDLCNGNSTAAVEEYRQYESAAVTSESATGLV